MDHAGQPPDELSRRDPPLRLPPTVPPVSQFLLLLGQLAILGERIIPPKTTAVIERGNG